VPVEHCKGSLFLVDVRAATPKKQCLRSESLKLPYFNLFFLGVFLQALQVLWGQIPAFSSAHLADVSQEGSFVPDISIPLSFPVHSTSPFCLSQVSFRRV
jgi:hypothetical protein